MIEIKEYSEKYIEQISDIIIRNLLEINSKDYGIEKVEEMAKDFTVEKLKDTLKNRKKVFVAIKDNEIVGTASIDVSWYSPDEYYIFIDINNMLEQYMNGSLYFYGCFVDLSSEQIVDGIRFIPMRLEL